MHHGLTLQHVAVWYMHCRCYYIEQADVATNAAKQQVN